MYPKSNKGKFLRQLRDYCVLTIAMILGAVGVELFLLPNEITTGGIIGVASIVYWGTGIPAHETFFVLNALLLVVALKVLGWRFCAKTIYGVVIFTVASTVLQNIMPPDFHLLADQKFMSLPCPACGKRTAFDTPWFDSGREKYMAISVCPQHGFVFGQMHFKRTPSNTLSYTARCAGASSSISIFSIAACRFIC